MADEAATAQKVGLELTLAGLKQQELRDTSMLTVLQAELQVSQARLAQTQRANASLMDYVRTLRKMLKKRRD